jgi:hypothetical protein
MIKGTINSATLLVIKNCIGKTVSDIARIQYYYNDREDLDGFGDLEITFIDNSFLTLTGLGDAESIKAISEKADIPKMFNVTDNDVASWKRIDLKGDKEWKKIIGQNLQNAEIIWNIHKELDLETLISCVLFFYRDFITFYETGSDSAKFFVNRPLPLLDNETRI